MKKTLVGVNDDGSPHYSYVAEGDEELVITGPIVAQFQLSDGTVYDVTDPVVAIKDDSHREELLLSIGDHYETAGHTHMTDPNVRFVHDRAVPPRGGVKAPPVKPGRAPKSTDNGREV